MIGEHSVGTTESENRKLLVGLLTRHQARLFAYIHMLVPDPHAAWDMLQQTCLVICEKFDSFDPKTDFVAWARQIAWWEVCSARQKFARHRLLLLDDEILQRIAQSEEAVHGSADRCRDALAVCLERLPPRDREMILTRYESGTTVQQIAERCGRSLTAAYKALTRIRRALLDCVKLRLAEEHGQ